jgi:hypothetical protein
MANLCGRDTKGHPMSHLRFSPDEYQALSLVCLPLNLNHRLPSHRLKRLLVRSLADTNPALARRVAGLPGQGIRLIRDHFREVRHGLTAKEVGLLAEQAGALFLTTCFVCPSRLALVEYFREARPDLAAKLDRLGQRQFEVLCEQFGGVVASRQSGPLHPGE